MKQLTFEEASNAPGIIWFIYMAGVINRPVGLSTYLEAVRDYPEYFPEETERKRKFDTIPSKVHTLYEEEYSKLHEQVYGANGLMDGKGIFYYSQHPEEYLVFKRQQEALSSYFELQVKLLKDKHYSKYLD